MEFHKRTEETSWGAQHPYISDLTVGSSFRQAREFSRSQACFLLGWRNRLPWLSESITRDSTNDQAI